MSRRDRPNYVSVIGFNYLEPILVLLERLLAIDAGGQNELQASPVENGFASSIIVLAVLLLESAIARVKYDKKKVAPKSALRFMQSEFPEFPDLEGLEEVFVIRDAIVHNHLWEAQFDWGDERGIRLLATQIWEGSGDKKFQRVVNYGTQRSRKLELNLFPTRISRRDAIIVLRKVYEVLVFLEENGSPLVNVSNQYRVFKGELFSLKEIIAQLPSF